MFPMCNTVPYLYNLEKIQNSDSNYFDYYIYVHNIHIILFCLKVEKYHIAVKHLFPKQLDLHGLGPDMLQLTDDAIYKIS